MERIENLDYNLKIYQNSALYTFTSDAVLLAKFASAKPSDIVVDLGTGSGIIALYLAKKTLAKKIYGVEIQKSLAEMAIRSVELNNLQNRIEIVNMNMLDFKASADVVVCNPPYKKAGNIVNQSSSAAIARHEVEINLDKLILTVKRLLKFGGKFYVSYDANRSAELIYKLSKNGLEPKTMFFTQSNPEADASLVFIKAVLGGKPSVRVLKTLITNDKSGKYIENLKVEEG